MVRVKYIVVLLSILLSYNAPAQTQQGIVKTRGRMDNGQLVAGTRLSGATITLNFGNSLVSGSQGEFSFNVPSGKTYSLVMAEKKGYTLADPEYTRRSFNYSEGNTFYVVLEDVNQRLADIIAATRKVRRTLTAQLQKREKEIETLKEQNRLTEEEYQKRLQELYDNQSKSEQLVKEMAERYASTDYDQLDEFNRQVQMYIEDGELQKADSMIRSKGDMEKRVAEYHNVVAANHKVRQQLEQSEAAAAKTYEDLSQDLLRHSEIFQQTFQHDSALYCLKMRADLDTTNVDAVRDYAALCYEQVKNSECETYYMICLRAYALNGDIGNRATILNNLGNLFQRCFDFEKSEKYYNLSLQDFTELFEANPDLYRECLAMLQNNMGNLYNAREDYTNSEKFFRTAIDNYKQLYNQNPDKYRALLAQAQNNLGILYLSRKNYEISKHYLNIALQNRGQLFRQDPDTYRTELAESQNNLGMLYYRTQNLRDSEKFYKAAIDNYELLFKNNPDKYRQGMAIVLNNLGDTYNDLHDYANSEKYYKLAVVHYEELYKQNPDIFKGNIAMIYYKLAYSSAEISHFSEAISSINKSISGIPKEANFYDAKGEILLMQGKNDEALKMWNMVLELKPNYLKDYPDGTNLSNGLKKLGLIK